MDTAQLALGYIETFAGNGKARSTGDGKRAVKAGIPLPHHAALDKHERWFYFAESGQTAYGASTSRGHAAQFRRHR